jgi:hypothetical protein
MSIKEKLYQFSKSLNDNLKLFISISLGIFLFVLFFQPFPLDRFDFNNKLIFVSGFGAIVYLFMFLVRVVFSWIFLDKNKNGYDPVFASTMSGFIILVLSSVSFAFYLRYVGSDTITFFIMIKIILICLVPPVILSIYDKNMDLAQQNESLILEKKIIQHQIEKYEEDYLNKTIELVSDNNSENLNLLIAELAFIKSADNYVEVVYKEGDTLKKKLLRNTLKNIELQLKQYTNFIRCHRICIVNVHYVDKLTRAYNNHWLVIKGYHEQIPVSRQYLLKLKEVL